MFERYRRVRKEVTVDLIPVMNLFVVLIPFLLLSAAFFHVGVIPTSLPSQSASSDIATETDKVTVTLQVRVDKIHVSCANPEIDPEVLTQLSTSIERVADGSDLEQLTVALYAIKDVYGASDTVIVLPGEGVLYKDVVSVLDAAREAKLGEDGDEETVPLFPVVVLSKKV